MIKRKIGRRMTGHAKTIFRRIFPKRLVIPEQVNRLLASLYPNLDLGKIRFYEGLPWFIDQGFAHAITLPGVYNLNLIHIYFAKPDFESDSGLSTIVHECFHALQYHELFQSKGIGLFRIFMVHYLGEFFRLFFKYVRRMGVMHARQLAYDQHPMEIPAFEVDRNFRDLLAEKDREFIYRAVIPESLVIYQSGHTYQAGRLPYWFSVVLLTGLTLLTPLVEFFIFLYAGLCLVFGKLLSVIGI